VTHFAQDERQALCDLFLEVGPDAPTLCDGWVTGDLAAHLVIRERRPDAAAGVLLPPLAGYTNKVLQATTSGTGWDQLVARVRAGPPAPLRLVDEAMNTVEYFVHHEDVRRAAPGWEPRHLDPAEERVLWNRLRMGARMLARRVPLGLVADAPGFGQGTLKPGAPVVTVTGPPGELVLLAFGRTAVARLEYQGDEISVERLRHARLGL
jgi:uncharacterized protein (TIGR03085 family)